MANIPANYNEGGSNEPPSGANDPTLAKTLRDMADDFEALRTKYNDLLTKIDLEGTLAGDYVSTLEMAAGDISTKKV